MSRKLLLAATLLAAPFVLPRLATAQPVTGLYIGAGAGANFMEQQQFRTLTPPGSVPGPFGRHGFDTGVTGVGSVGWGFGNGLRVEMEGDYRYNRFDSGAFSIGGHETKYGAMANALFDLDVGSPYVFPYVGAGAGYQWSKETLRATAASGLRTGLDDTEGSFAYQAIAGLSFPIPPVVGLSLTLEYRFLDLVGDRDYHIGAGTTAGLGGATVRTRADLNHSVMLGLRYAFNVAPPPPPAVAVATAPVPQAARTYLVFFDWDRADLTDRARQIIAEAAQATTRVQVTRIEVNGYTDRSGTPQYNQGLSIRRAQNVANELVRLGVPRQSISAQGFGENNPLVPTADGVREPQNRRVEIILR